MARLNVLHYPDSRLRKPALPVETVDASIRTLVADMLETMYAAPGIGLAATQVNVQKRVVVMDLSEEKNQPRVFINPTVLECEGESEGEEGCLSVPGF
jgi:peptide deformylase